jgi:predicted Zn-dependent protease
MYLLRLLCFLRPFLFYPIHFAPPSCRQAQEFHWADLPRFFGFVLKKNFRVLVVEPMKLQPPATHHLSSAQGWLELGNVLEAAAELEQIAAGLQDHPEVLEVRWQVSAEAKKWEHCLELADLLIRLAPLRPTGWVHRSFALHEMKRTREALENLLPALIQFPDYWLIQYNLACYCCRLKEHDRALRFYKSACRSGDTATIKKMALQDSDLRDLWERI